MRFPILALISLAACSSDPTTAPSDAVPRSGVWDYVGLAGAGTLTITYATKDSIAGVWDVENAFGGMRGPATLGKWNLDAYVLFGTSRGTTYSHRLRPNGDVMGCSAQYVGDAGSRRPCTMTRRK